MARMKNSAFLSIRHFSIIFKKKEAGKKVHAEDCERKIAQADCKICEFLLCKNSHICVCCGLPLLFANKKTRTISNRPRSSHCQHACFHKLENSFYPTTTLTQTSFSPLAAFTVVPLTLAFPLVTETVTSPSFFLFSTEILYSTPRNFRVILAFLT